MTRFELIRMLALNEIADNYEEPVHIHDQLNRLGERCGMNITPLDVRQALISLAKLGWAKAYRLVPGDPIEEIEGAPTLEQVGDFYYSMTDKGREAQEAFEDWPFDDSGTILPSWRPPVE